MQYNTDNNSNFSKVKIVNVSDYFLKYRQLSSLNWKMDNSSPPKRMLIRLLFCNALNINQTMTQTMEATDRIEDKNLLHRFIFHHPPYRKMSTKSSQYTTLSVDRLKTYIPITMIWSQNLIKKYTNCFQTLNCR